jgi:integrase
VRYRELLFGRGFRYRCSHEQHNIVWLPDSNPPQGLTLAPADDRRLTVRNFAPNTQQSYLGQVGLFARHFGKSPEQLGPEQIRNYQIYLAQERKVSVGTRIVAVSALRFLYAVTWKRDGTVPLIPGPKKDHRLPVILSPQEVLEVLQAAPSFPHHVIFSTMDGTGMRVSEAVHLRADNIDSHRMMIRIELSKGHKDRDVQLSPKRLELLRCYWRKVRPGEWMFPGQNPHQPLSREAVGDAVVQPSRRVVSPSTPRRTRCATMPSFGLCRVDRERPHLSSLDKGLHAAVIPDMLGIVRPSLITGL